MVHLSTVHGLRLRYIIGLSAIALLVTASFITMKRVVSRQRDYSSLVNIAGHQSGLSNRIAYFASLMAITDDESVFNMARAQVGRAIHKMKSAHARLRKGDPAAGIPHITNDNLTIIYENPMVGLDLALNRFLRRAGEVYESDMANLDTESIAYIYVTTYGPHVLDPMLNAAVDEYELIGRQAIFRIERFELIIWLATLGTLLLEIAFIFRPMERHVRETIQSLESSITELQNTRKRLLAAQKLANVGDWEWSPETGALTWSDQIYEICGVSSHTFVLNKDAFLRLVHPEDRHKVKPMLNSMDCDKIVSDLEYRIIRPDGVERLVFQQAVAPTGKTKPRKSLSGTIQDITDRKKIEAELRDSEEFHKELFEMSPIGLYLQDFSEVLVYAETLKKDGVKDLKHHLSHNQEVLKHLIGLVKIKQVNKAGVDLYQTGSREAAIADFGRIISLNEPQHFIDQVVDFSEGKDWYEGEAKNVDHKGNIINVLLRKAVINREVYGLSKILVSVVDITDLRKALMVKTELEARLQQAQKMESIGTLAGGIAHDFNNILFPIIGISELMMQDFPPDSIEYQNAHQIMKAGKRGSNLVKQILAFSRQTEQKMIPIRAQQVLKEVLKLSRATIPVNIDIEQDIQKDCGTIMADPTKIHQIAMNLITNAYHAVESQGGKITVQLKEILIGPEQLPNTAIDSGTYAVLSISDTGTGIDSAILDKIFDPYFTTKKQGKGTGLGLAVVYGIVQHHHGEIQVLSQVGFGTTFKVYLPVLENPPDAIETEYESASPRGNERILLVDDEKPVLEIEKQILERLGYQVSTRINSLEALEAFKANSKAFDLVITDMAMPNMTGEQLAREILSIKPNMPIIVCTGFSDRICRETINSNGIKGYLMKPVITAELAQMVRRVLNNATE